MNKSLMTSAILVGSCTADLAQNMKAALDSFHHDESCGGVWA